MFFRSVCFFLIVYSGLPALMAQSRSDSHVILKDAKTRNPLVNITLDIIIKNKIAAFYTDSKGGVTIYFENGISQIIINAAGYKTDTVAIELLNSKKELHIFLNPLQNVLTEVLVKTQQQSKSNKNAFGGTQKLKVSEFNNIPVLFGEKDILKSIQTLPGIKNAGEGSSGIYVRGGSSDQNLVLLDGATVYNPSHLLGFFSVFNSDILNDVTVYKGALPSEYGGRLSSVIEIKTNKGDTSEYKVTGGAGLIASRLNVQGPIVKNKASFLFSVRKSYPDQYLVLSNDSAIKNNKLNFTDYNGNLYWRLNKRNELFVNLYQGYDHFSLGNAFGIQYGNTIDQLRWKHQFKPDLFSNTSIIYSNYKYNIFLKPANTNLYIYSDLFDYSVKHEIQKVKNETDILKFGFDITAHNIRPVSLQATNGSGYSNFDPEIRRNLEWNLFFSSTQRINRKTVINYGLRYNAFSILGPGYYYSTDSLGNQINLIYYKPFQVGKPVVNLEPRFSLNYTIDENQVLKFAYARNVQNIHMVSNSTSANPTDLFFATNNNISPEMADQLSMGYFKNIANQVFEISAEVYFKKLQNQIDYKNGSQLLPNQDIESLLTFGKGRAYGFEFFLRKKQGLFTGWLSYTLSKTERLFSAINNGKWFNARQDRLHEISAVFIYQPTKKCTVSSSWVYYTGTPVTFPTGKYRMGGQVFYYYSDRNQSRMPDYHRLDLSVTYFMKGKGNQESNFTFSIYNVYNRENAYSISFEDDPTISNKTNALQTTLFKMVPSVTYNFKF